MKRRKALQLVAASAPLPFVPTDWPATQTTPTSYNFGPDFTFGFSTSSYQIEGAVHEDGRSAGIWDVFCHGGNHIKDGDNADIACDHYHRMPEDVALIAESGVKNYRFSVSWSRLYPELAGAPNARGFAFYDRLLDELHKKDITPWLCLYHWDLPQYLQERGGWTNRDTSYRLAEFSDRVSRYFGDRIGHYMVLNEAAVHSYLGHGLGFHAPGLTGKDNWVSALHHLNLGQGLAIQALRSSVPQARIGTVASCEPVRPSTNSPGDVKAAAVLDAMWNGAVLDPLFLGKYPDLVADDFAPYCQPGDLEHCRQKIDLLGVNYYNRLHIHYDPKYAMDVMFGADNDPVKFRAMTIPMTPDGLYEIVMRIHHNYNQPEIFISENGFATVKDGKPGSGLEDDGRLAYLAANLQFLQKSIESGANVSGYFIWSLIDNFEWDAGMKYRFGLVDVDFKTLKRTPKQSYYWYSALVKGQAGLQTA
jgi:beta-glucosidase